MLFFNSALNVTKQRNAVVRNWEAIEVVWNNNSFRPQRSHWKFSANAMRVDNRLTMIDLIKASDISVSRQGNKILENVSLAVGDHDFLIIGPNGVGKSMLLKCLMGFYPPDVRAQFRKCRFKVDMFRQNFSPEHTMPISVRRFLGLRRKIDKSEILAVAEKQVFPDF